jgi:hypothetical protein
MYEPGFLATRIHWLRFLLRRVNAGQLFVSLGMLPLENELGSRAMAAFSWTVQRRHGVLALSEIFEERVASRFPPGTTSADLWRRDLFAEARASRRDVLSDTRGPLHDRRPHAPHARVIERLAPLATIYIVGVSYDPFVSRRFSMLYRVQALGEGSEPWMSRMTKTLAAIRPVTASQLLGTWLHEYEESFTLDGAVAAVEEALAALSARLFVDPELRSNPRAMVRGALPPMLSWEILTREGDRYRVAPRRRHPQFPFVEDILAYHARFLEETLENAAYARE